MPEGLHRGLGVAVIGGRDTRPAIAQLADHAGGERPVLVVDDLHLHREDRAADAVAMARIVAGTSSVTPPPSVEGVVLEEALAHAVADGVALLPGQRRARGEEQVETLQRRERLIGEFEQRRNCVGTRKRLVPPSRAMVAMRSSAEQGGGFMMTVPPEKITDMAKVRPPPK